MRTQLIRLSSAGAMSVVAALALPSDVLAGEVKVCNNGDVDLIYASVHRYQREDILTFPNRVARGSCKIVASANLPKTFFWMVEDPARGNIYNPIYRGEGEMWDRQRERSYKSICLPVGGIVFEPVFRSVTADEGPCNAGERSFNSSFTIESIPGNLTLTLNAAPIIERFRGSVPAVLGSFRLQKAEDPVLSAIRALPVSSSKDHRDALIRLHSTMVYGTRFGDMQIGAYIEAVEQIVPRLFRIDELERAKEALELADTMSHASKRIPLQRAIILGATGSTMIAERYLRSHQEKFLPTTDTTREMVAAELRAFGEIPLNVRALIKELGLL